MQKEIRSKYQQKNYKETEYVLEEETCSACGKMFMVNYGCCELTEINGDHDYIQIFCPYCSKHQYRYL